METKKIFSVTQIALLFVFTQKSLQKVLVELTRKFDEKVLKAILASEKPIHDTEIFQDVRTKMRPKFLKTNNDIIMIRMATIMTSKLYNAEEY